MFGSLRLRTPSTRDVNAAEEAVYIFCCSAITEQAMAAKRYAPHPFRLLSVAMQAYTVFQKRPPFHFVNNLVKSQPILMIFGMLNPQKFDINILQTYPSHLSDVATLPWDIQKSHFEQCYSNILVIIYVISENKTNCNCCIAAQLLTYYYVMLPIICIWSAYGQFCDPFVYRVAYQSAIRTNCGSRLL